MGRILSIDYGMKRTGIAVTDPLRIIAKPLIVVPTDDLDVWLENYLKLETVDIIVVGMPLRHSGENTHATIPVLEYLVKLKEKYPAMPIDTMDERLTSKMARQSLIDSGVPKNKRKVKGSLDSVSAALILQSYLQKIS